MIKLYQKDNKFSVHSMKGANQVDLPDQTYRGLTILDNRLPSGYELLTLDNQILRVTDDNFEIILKSSKIIKGRLVGEFSWQPYKNKFLLLPVGLLDTEELDIGDIVRPVMVSSVFRSADTMIYLGKKHVVEYSSTLVKSVRKNLHVFVSLSSDYKNKIFTYQTIKSAFFKKSKDVELAQHYMTEINKNSMESYFGYYDLHRRSFYLDDFKQTKVKPVLIKVKNNPISPSSRLQLIFKYNNEFYMTTYSQLNGYGGVVDSNKLKNIDVVSGTIDADLIKNFNSRKYVSLTDVATIPKQTTYDFYGIALEIYQNGVLVGRK